MTIVLILGTRIKSRASCKERFTDPIRLGYGLAHMIGKQILAEGKSLEPSYIRYISMKWSDKGEGNSDIIAHGQMQPFSQSKEDEEGE